MRGNVILLLMGISLIACWQPVSAQNIELKKKLEGKRNLNEIMQIVRSHLSEKYAAENNKLIGEEDKGEKEWYFWNRFAKYYDHRVDDKGNIYENIHSIIWNEWEKYKDIKTASTEGPLAVSNVGTWTGMGPFNVTYTQQGNAPGLGRVNCIAFHPTDPNTFIIGTPASGIWKTITGGSSWFALNDDMPSLGIGGLTYDVTNPNIIYALTGDGESFTAGTGVWLENSIGILKSGDGGVRWTKVHDFPSGIPGAPSGVFGYKLLQHPFFTNLFFAATSRGIFRSSDGGNTWTNSSGVGDFTDIEVCPDGNGAVMYAASRNFINPFFRSTDYGATWSTQPVTNISSPNRIALAVSANNSNSVYILTGATNRNTMYQGIFRSTDQGVNFTRQTPASPTQNILGGNEDGSGTRNQADYDLCIESNPANEPTIITGGVNIWRSTNSATTLTRATHWVHNVPGVVYAHADIHNLAYNPLNNLLYACTDGGVFRSNDHGVNWADISNQLHITAGVNGDWRESDPAVLAIGTQDNGTLHRPIVTNNYRHIGGGDGSDCLINQTNGNDIVYAETGTLTRTTNPGVTVSPITPPNFRNFYPTLARNYSNDDNIFAGDSFNVFRSSNRGSSWTGSINPPAGLGTTILTTCRSNTLQLYAGNRTALYRSGDGGANWTIISTNPGYTTLPVADVEATHAVSSFIYSCHGGYQPGQKVFFSSNAGNTWTNISGTLPNVACHSIVLDANNNVYVGTDVGVFVRPNGQNDWRPYFNGLPCTMVTDLLVNQTFGRLIAITFGHGNFFSDLYGATCPPTIDLFGIITGNKFFEAGSITATGLVRGGEGTAVAAAANSEILMSAGFTVEQGNQFRAYNAPCGAPGVPLRVDKETDSVHFLQTIFKASADHPFPNGHLNASSDNIFTVRYEKAGDYLLRITNREGAVQAPPVTKKIAKPGEDSFNPAGFRLPNGYYYVQLFYNNELIHFLEYNPGITGTR